MRLDCYNLPKRVIVSELRLDCISMLSTARDISWNLPRA